MQVTDSTSFSAISELHGDRSFNSRPWIIANNLKIFVLVVKNGIRLPFDNQLRIGTRFPFQLQFRLLYMVVINMAVTTGPNKVSNP